MTENKERKGQPESVIGLFVDWIGDFAASRITPRVAECARFVLLDSLACALYARDDAKSEASLRTVRALGGVGDCTVIGTRLRTSLPLAAFANGVLIRTLDLNDAYAGRRQIGHPSDNIGAALAAAEKADRSGEDLIRAIRLGYEIYGRVLDMGDPESPWDHVTVSGLVTAATTGWLLGLPRDRLAHAIALSAMHCATMGEVRVGQVSGAKSIANAVVAQTAALLTMLASEGVTGPNHALDGARGYARLILEGVDFSGFFSPEDPAERITAVGLKQYPCFALAQGPISAAVELRKRLDGNIQTLDHLRISIADTGPARLRLGDSHGRAPSSREAADHSLYFLTAVALLDGQVGLDQFRGDRWKDNDVLGLIARMETQIDPLLQPATALPCRLTAELAGGAVVEIHRAASPGNPAAPLSWEEVTEKFRICSRNVLQTSAQNDIIGLVEDMSELSSVRRLLELLGSPA